MNFRKWFLVPAMSPIAMTLLFTGVVFSVIMTMFSYVGYPFFGIPDFLFLFVLVSLAAIYRPGWIFLLLVSVLPLEIADLAPASFGSGIRPYQFLTLAVFVGLGVRFLARRPLPGIPRFGVGDFLLLLIPVGSLTALVNAPERGVSFHLSIILFSFYGLYILFRLFVRTSEDIGRIFPFVIASALVTVCSALIQNILFLGGNGSFEVMPGRPNAMFAEPDWLGMFLTLLLAALLSVGYMIASRTESVGKYFRMKRTVFLLFVLIGTITTLIITVSRSAWLGAAVETVIAIGVSLIAGRRRAAGMVAAVTGVSTVASLVLVFAMPLTNFDLFGRAGSVGSGLQSITVSCDRETPLPERIASVDELASLGCRHIDLDEVDVERAAGRFVTITDRDDPNVSIRKKIYGSAIALGLEHPLLGSGWGTVTGRLGTDERGAGFNASDIFLEVWLGSGLCGLIGLVGFLFLLAVRSLRDWFRSRGTFPYFLVAAFSGLIVFDLFNSGILLGFFWGLLGVAGSYLFHEADFSETL